MEPVKEPNRRIQKFNEITASLNRESNGLFKIEKASLPENLNRFSRHYIDVEEAVSELHQLENAKHPERMSGEIVNFFREKWIPQVAESFGTIKQWHNITKAKEKGMKAFNEIMEKFMFWGYSSEYLKKMKEVEKSRVCHYVSDPTIGVDVLVTHCFYKCKDCKDCETEVRLLCIDCFENSVHREHEYTIQRYGAGNYCACGDAGKWKSTWTCSSHSGLPFESPLPEDIKIRARAVMEAIMLIADEVVSDDLMDTSNQASSSNYHDQCLVFHLIGGYKFSKLFSFVKFNFYISDEDLEECRVNMARDDFFIMMMPPLNDSITKNKFSIINFAKKKIMKTAYIQVLSVHQALHLEFSRSLLNYLQGILECGGVFRRIFFEVVTRKTPSRQESLSIHLLGDYSFGKIKNSIGYVIVKLIILATMKDYNNKKQLAKIILEFLDRFRAGFLNKFDFFKPLFTTPGLFVDLIVEDNALKIWTNRFLQPHKATMQDNMSINTSHNSFVSQELQYLLLCVPQNWKEQLRKNFQSGFSSFLHVLTSYQNCDNDTRRRFPSVVSIDIFRSFANVLKEENDLWNGGFSFINWCKSDDKALERAWEVTVNILHSKFDVKEEEESLNHFGRYATYDSTGQPVRILVSVLRLLTALYVIKANKNQEITLDLTSIFNLIMRIHVIRAETNAGLWLVNSTFDRLCDYMDYSDSYQWDVCLLQIVGSIRNSNQFMNQLLAKYRLLDWITTGKCHTELALEDPTNDKTMVIAETFLRDLNIILTSRYMPEVGSEVSEELCLKIFILHQLCVKPLDYRTLCKIIFSKVCNARYKYDFHNIIYEIAVTNHSGLYVPKPEATHLYHPLYYLYSYSEFRDSKENQMLRLKEVGEPQCFPPPPLPRLKNFFTPLVNIFQCDVTLHLIKTVLERSLNRESQNYSDEQLEYTLYLIGFALREEESLRYPTLEFTKRSIQWNILECLENLLASYVKGINKELIQWTIMKFKAVVGVSTVTIEAPAAIDDEAKKQRKEKLASYRKKLMASMKDAQCKFVEESNNRGEIEDVNSENSIQSDEEEEESVIKDEKTCVICLKTERTRNMSMMIVGLIQPSNVLSFKRKCKPSNLDSLVLPFDLSLSDYVHSCGHPMHYWCLEKELTTQLRKLKGYKFPSFDKETEFLCPLCNFVGNAKLPMLPKYTKKNQIHEPLNLEEFKMRMFQKFMVNNFRVTNPFYIWKMLSYTIHVEETLLRNSKRPLLGNLTFSQHASLETLIRIGQYIPLICSISKTTAKNFSDMLEQLIQKPPEKLLDIDMFSVVLASRFLEYNIFDSTNSQTLLNLCVAQMARDVKSNGSNEDQDIVWQSMKKLSIPFLRCCVLLRSFLPNPPVSYSELTTLDGDTFENMCQYLGLPQTREEFVGNRDISKIIFIDRSIYNQMHTNRLIELPFDYRKLISFGRSFKCAICYDKNSLPGICLVCGETFCLKYNCAASSGRSMRRQVDHHFDKCVSSIYLNIGDATVHINRNIDVAIALQTPYVNEYNTSTFGFYGEFPMFLSNKIYENLRTLWLKHGYHQEVFKLREKFKNKEFEHVGVSIENESTIYILRNGNDDEDIADENLVNNDGDYSDDDDDDHREDDTSSDEEMITDRVELNVDDVMVNTDGETVSSEEVEMCIDDVEMDEED